MRNRSRGQSGSNLHVVEFCGADQQQPDAVCDRKRSYYIALNRKCSACCALHLLPAGSNAFGVRVDFTWLGVVIAAQSQASADPCLTDGHAGIRILGGMWWKRFVDPHDGRNATWDVFGENHRDFWQLEPQRDIYGGRQLNSKNGVRDMRCKPTEAAAASPA